MRFTAVECAVGCLKIRHGVSMVVLLCSSIAPAAVWSSGIKMRLRSEPVDSANDG